MSTSTKPPYCIGRRAGKKGPRPPVGGQAGVEKYATGHHYSEVTSSGWPNSKRYQTQNNNNNNNYNKNNKNNTYYHSTCIGSINTTTLKDPMKLALCISQCKFLKNYITFLQETHIIGNKTTIFEDDELKGWTFINCGMKMKASAGVGIALSPNVKVVDIDNILDGRILLVRLVLHGIQISALCAYAPTELYAESSKQVFFNTLQKAIKESKKKHPRFKILIGADMNATIGCDSNGTWTHLGTNNDDLETNDNGMRLLTLSKECDLYIMNSFYHSKSIHRHTWYSPTGFTKRVDYILAEWHIKKLSSNCRVYRGASIPFETDHRLLALSCSFPSNYEKKQFFQKPTSKNKMYTNIKSLKDDPIICNNFSKQLDKHLSPKPNICDIDAFQNSFTECICKASEEEIPKISVTLKNFPWTNDDYNKLLQQRRECKDPETLRSLNISIRKSRISLKNCYFSDLAKNINIANEARKIEEEFRLCKSYTMTKHSEKQFIPNEKLSKHFEEHFSERNIEIQPEVSHPENYPHILPPNDLLINSDTPTITEVGNITRKFKNGKCLGTDLLYPEHIKHNKSNRFSIYLMLLITTIWTTFTVPSSWLVSSITCIFKNKGSRSEAENYRGLSIMSTFSKVLTHLVIARIRNAYEKLISNSQFGFRSNRSTTDAIFILQNAINMSSTPLFMCFIDLKAAYDWIDRDMLFKILEIRLKSPIIVNILKTLYTGTSAAIKGSKIFFKTLTGCRQGGVESPVIFNIFLDFVLRCAEHEVLQKFPNTGLQYSFLIPSHCSNRQQRTVCGLSGFQRLRMILYADDIVLLCGDVDELSEIINIYNQTFLRFGLRISTNKTETMVFNVPENIKAKSSHVSVGGIALKNVRTFKYLGHMITNKDEDASNYLNFRIASAFQKWNELKHVLTDRRISMCTRTKILESCVRSRLLYSVQAWQLSTSELRKIQSIWHGFLRKMVTNGFKRKNVPKEYQNRKSKAKSIKAKEDLPKPDDLNWAFIFSNEHLETITKTSNITNFCKQQHLKYLAHVTRLGNESYQKQILFSCDRKKFARDRWRKIEKEVNLSTMQIQKTMQNKNEFMSLLYNIYK